MVFFIRNYNCVGEIHEYICPFQDCSRRYTSRSGFLNHQRKHTEMSKQLESSTIAPESFCFDVFINGRVSPLPIQQLPQQFVCPIPGCFKSFNSQMSLNFHKYRVHLGIDTSVCQKSRWFVIIVYVTPSIRLRESYLRQQLQIQKLKDRVKELEAMTALLSKRERQEFQKEFRKQNRQQEATKGDSTVVIRFNDYNRLRLFLFFI